MKVYSIVAKKYIEVPDKVAPVAQVSGDGHRRVAMELAAVLIDAEKQIKELTANLSAETVARKAAEKCAAEEKQECEAAETALEKERDATAKQRLDHGVSVASNRVELATVKGVVETERALRVAAEKRAVNAEDQCRLLLTAPKPAVAPPFDIGAIQKTIRDALASNKPPKSQYAVDVSERDANGRISKFNFKPK